jgi:hypothetical protein
MTTTHRTAAKMNPARRSGLQARAQLAVNTDNPFGETLRLFNIAV